MVLTAVEFVLIATFANVVAPDRLRLQVRPLPDPGLIALVLAPR
jgi:hypothetical protein